MAEVPNTVLGRIEFFEQHIPVWAADPTAIGLTAAQVIELSTLTGAARVAYNSAQAGRQTAKATTLAQNNAVSDMMTFGTAAIATIRAFADINDDQGVYVAAEITPDGTPSPLPPPVPATNLAADLLNTGQIKLSWKGTIANGTFYAVWRRLGEGEPYETLGSVSAKSFIDTTIPVATPEATYYLVTHRDELSSEATEPITVRFGYSAQTGTGTGTGSESAGGGLSLAA